MIRDPHTNARPVNADYQSTTPVDPAVLDVLVRTTRDVLGNPHASDHALGWQAMETIEASRQLIARSLGCDADSIVFTSGATESNNLAILGSAARAPKSRRRILVSAIEHKCVLAAAERAAEWFGCSVERLPVDVFGHVPQDELERRLGEDVLLVSIMTVHNEIGTIAPIARYAALCNRVGAVLHSDAAQALCAIPLDVAELGAGLLSLSGHKIYGPKGIGALIVRPDLLDAIAPLIVGGGQQGGLRSGTLPVPLCAALAEAVRIAADTDASAERARVRSLRNRFAGRLLEDPRVRLNGPALDDRHPGNCNLAFEGWDAHDLLLRLQPKLVASTGSACTSGTPEPSYALRAIGLSARDAGSSVRFSFGKYTSETDIEEAVALVSETLQHCPT